MSDGKMSETDCSAVSGRRRTRGRHGREGGGCTQCVHGRSRMAIDLRIPTMPGRSMSGCHNQADVACTKREAP